MVCSISPAFLLQHEAFWLAVTPRKRCSMHPRANGVPRSKKFAAAKLLQCKKSGGTPFA